MLEKNIFFISRPSYGVYRAIILGCKKNCEQLVNLKLEIRFFEKKFPTINFILFFLKNIINLNFLDKKKYLYITYRKCEIGRHAAATTYRDIKTYKSKFYRVFNLLKYLFLAGVNVDHAYSISNSIVGAYIDHCGYLNGIYFRVFALKKKIIYTNNYPRGLFSINFKKKKNAILSNNENAIRLFKNKKKLDLTNSRNKMLEFLKNPNLLPWMRYTKYTAIKNYKMNFNDVDYVVYCHSFVDGSLWFGNDEFPNIKDWLEFTLHELRKNNAKVIIKAHPNFYNKTIESASLDKKIFDQIIRKHENKNFVFINKAVPNYELLKKLSKKTILISHHGTSLLEGAVSGFKTICSTSTIWSPDFKISNQWFNPTDYKRILKKKWKDLYYTNNNDLKIVLHQFIINKYSLYGKNAYSKIICEHLNINSKQFYSKHVSNIIQKISEKSLNKLVDKLSNNVEKIYK